MRTIWCEFQSGPETAKLLLHPRAKKQGSSFPQEAEAKLSLVRKARQGRLREAFDVVKLSVYGFGRLAQSKAPGASNCF